MLLSRKKITEDLIDIMMGWRHSGFNVYCGPRIQPCGEEAMENLGPYIIRASFSRERMTPYPVRGRLYIPEESKVLYRSKDGNLNVLTSSIRFPGKLKDFNIMRPLYL
jgi:hypothetical protein